MIFKNKKNQKNFNFNQFKRIKNCLKIKIIKRILKIKVKKQILKISHNKNLIKIINNKIKVHQKIFKISNLKKSKIFFLNK